MKIVPAEPGHLVDILDNLSKQNRMEIALTLWTPARFASQVFFFMAKGVADVGLIDGKPQCMLAIAEQRGVPTTLFLATDDFFANPILGVREGRRYLRAARNEYGPLYTFTLSPHPDTARWFKLLGYKEKSLIDGRKIFVWE